MAKNSINVQEIFREGDRRLSEKLTILQQNPDIKFADFSTRRRFSLAWEKHILERCLEECPENIVGTSNVALARELRMKPIGTFAHEMPMVYAGLASARGRDIRASHGRILNDWYDRYGKDLSIALTDTFTTDFFFQDFTSEQAAAWRGLRQDSGDPFAFGEKAIRFYQENGIDPREKTIVFSDSLDIGRIVTLAQQFKGRINTLYGWGGNFGSDLGFKNLNCVMKATHVRDSYSGNEADTVKLSDDKGKHTGPAMEIRRYKKEFVVPQPSVYN
jgi:nicotinate phosphoribosyltransferase